MCVLTGQDGAVIDGMYPRVCVLLETYWHYLRPVLSEADFELYRLLGWPAASRCVLHVFQKGCECGVQATGVGSKDILEDTFAIVGGTRKAVQT